MTTLTSPVVTADQARQYREEGYFILERVVPDAHVELLRSLCQGFIDDFNREMDEKGQLDDPRFDKPENALPKKPTPKK